jgi:ATP-dependent DNA helicase RecG
MASKIGEFEYRSSEAAGPASQREEFRRGFLHYYDRLWEVINLRNDRQHFQDGLFMMDVLTFSESAVREAVLNAVAHRDYRHAGSVFIRQFPRRIEIVSPGGFPQGITPENILDRQLPRNRRIADAFAKCGLVERAGQGANRIFESCIREGKPLPDFTHTDAHQVSLTLHGQVQDPSFVRFLERIARETATGFDTHDFVLLDLIHREATIPDLLKPRLRRLLELGIVESVGRGRGARYLLSRRFYVMTARAGTYTRRRGLDRETNKELILKHLRENPGGSPISDLQQVLPGLSRANIQRLLGELRRDGLARLVGERRGARWFPDSGNAQ